MFVDAAHDFAEPSRASRALRQKDIDRIVGYYNEFKDQYDESREGLASARAFSFDEIAANEFSLAVNRYVDISPFSVQVKRLTKQYKQYEMLYLKDVVVTVNACSSKSNFTPEDNALYMPISGSHRSICDLEELTISHKNAYQMIFDKNIVLAKYVEIFLRSELGMAMLKAVASGTTIPRLNWQNGLSDLSIPIPKISNQKNIIDASARLDSLRRHIDELDKNMALSPMNTDAVLEQSSKMLAAVGGLTDAEKVMSLIRKGESGDCEFKESFSLDIRKDTQEKYIETSSLKTIVAFLNTDGGTLLIGVSDDGSVPGLEREIKMFHRDKTDKFLLHFKNQLKSKIGEEFYPYIDHRIASVDHAEVLIVQVKSSSKACFLDGKDFYVRTNPATDKLEGPKLVEYIQNHFI